MRKVMNPVEDNRAYVKGDGKCVNVDNTGYHARLRKLKADKEKSDTINNLRSEVDDLKFLVKQLIEQGSKS